MKSSRRLSGQTNFDGQREIMRTGLHYLSLNRILLLTIGLWPYQQRKINRFQCIMLFGILATSIILQFTTFVTSNCTPEFVIKVLSAAFYCTTFLIKYWAFLINAEAVKYLLEQLQRTYHELKDEEEIAIIQRYWGISRRYTNVFTVIAICSTCALVASQFWSNILGFVLPINESRSSISLPIMTEYFINREKYFYLIVLHIDAALCIGGVTMIATGTMLIAYLQHACGMLKIASYRMERVMLCNVVRKNIWRTEDLIQEKLIYAIDMHRKAIKYIEFILSHFTVPYFFLIGFIVTTTSLNLFRIFHGVTYGYTVNDLLWPFIFLAVQYIYMFMANYFAQEIINHNDHLFSNVYNVQWYMAPLHIQKLILFLLQRGTKVFNLNIGGIFVGSLEGFGMMASASISYFTVIYSTGQ